MKSMLGWATVTAAVLVMMPTGGNAADSPAAQVQTHQSPSVHPIIMPRWMSPESALPAARPPPPPMESPQQVERPEAPTTIAPSLPDGPPSHPQPRSKPHDGNVP
jgi:hypothetical protein